MNPELKKKWVEALRSGEYEQGEDALKASYSNGSEYCCLGVLCDVAGRDTSKDHSGVDPTYYEHIEDLLSKYMQDNLVKLNDVEARRFDEIADYIEENL